MPNEEMDHSHLYKYGSLVALTLQNTIVILMMRASRLTENPDGKLYIASTAVVMGECVKLCVCIGIILATFNYNIKASIQHLREEIINKPTETLKMSVPAILYTLQGNLLFVGISNLDAATFQVSYQLKILTTAILSVVMLGRHLTVLKWASLVVLMGGVALVSIPDDAWSDNAQVAEAEEGINVAVGLTAVVTACTFSGFAGVYFEKILKGTSASIWVRNIQLGGFGLVIGLFIVYMNDSKAVYADGFFAQYNYLVWMVILLHAAGGLIIAVVVKYADNILKGFATAAAIILSAIISVFLFDFEPSRNFKIGATLVIAAVGMYSKPDSEAPSDLLPLSARMSSRSDLSRTSTDRVD